MHIDMTRMPDCSWIFRPLLTIAACALLASPPAMAQTAAAKGWPEAVETKPAPRPVKPVAVAVKPAPPVANPPADSAAELLRRQTELMERLAAALEEQRAVIVEQQRRIAALETLSPAAPVAPAVPPPAGPAAPPAPPAPPKPPAAPAIPPLTVETGGIKLKMSGLFQGWYSATSGATVDTFRLRRAELKFRGDMGPRANWSIMVDAAKSFSLQDAFASVVFSRALIVDVGQQKIPLSLAGTWSSSKLDTVERPLFASDKARNGGYGDVRDLGVMVRGAAGSRIDYYGGLFNGLGESQNDLDKNELKSVAARVVARPPATSGLQIGGSFALDGFGAPSATARQRHGLELLYTRPAFGVKSEWMTGRDGETPRRGVYVEATRRLMRNLQVVGRFDSWDPDTRADTSANDARERDWLGGLTYTIANSGVWFQFNFVEKTFGNLLPSRHVVLANLQSTW
jgi:Phosphate-selective porin O and P